MNRKEELENIVKYADQLNLKICDTEESIRFYGEQRAINRRRAYTRTLEYIYELSQKC